MPRRPLVPLALAALPLLLFAARTLSKRPEQQPCPDRRYLVQGSPLLPGDVAPEAIVITGKQVSFGNICRSTNATLKATAKGTRVKATFRSCTGLHGKAKLTATIEPSCEMMSGTVKVPRSRIKASFRARHSTCGDGVVDPGAGEQCDAGAGCPAGLECNNAALALGGW